MNLSEGSADSAPGTWPRAPRWPGLGVAVDVLTAEEARLAVEAMLRSPAGQWIASLNSEIVHAAWYDTPLRDALARAHLALPDGIGLVWASRILGGPLKQRVPGIEVLWACLGLCAREGWPVYFLGAAPGVADLAAASARVAWPGLRISGLRHGYFGAAEGAAVLEEVRRSEPRFVAVGLGHPKQELWLRQNMPSLPGAVGFACGGSIDVLAGTVRRAPEWARRTNLEWFYRLASSPRRWLRRAPALAGFAVKVLAARFVGLDPAGGSRPRR
jgi:N-acetylglucosaminyldiphosphoundecaprenol N-acetyl-beta-D-mannosaminyltransferase